MGYLLSHLRCDGAALATGGILPPREGHGPLATVGGPDADHDALIIVLATDPLFQAAALVDTQVYRTRNATVLLVVPEGNQELPVVRRVGASAVLVVPAVPRPFVPMINAALGSVLARQVAGLWQNAVPPLRPG